MKESSAGDADASSSEFMANFLSHHGPPQEAIDHFRNVPWLEKYLSGPKYDVIPTFSRHLKPSGEDYFFSRTINTLDTIPHMVTLQLKDMKTPEPTESNAQPETSQSESKPRIAVAPELPDAVTMISLGTRGVDGHPGLIHGGVTCALLDETMGLLTMLHANNVRVPGARHALFTAYLTVSYHAPLPTPGDYLVKLWVTSRQGRKWYSTGQITDQDGKVYAQGIGLWIVTIKAKL